MSLSLSLRLLFPLFGTLGSSYLLTAHVTTNCSYQSVVGRQIFCNNGACYDGTTDCQKGFDICTDPPSPPACESPTQLITQDESTVPIDAGKGTCYTSNNAHDIWLVEQYFFQCCECPPGYLARANVCGSHGPGLSGDLICVACSASNETLYHNTTDNSYSCTGSLGTPTSTLSASPGPSPSPSATSVSSGQQTACAAIKALAPVYDNLGLLSNLAGALCPTNNVFGTVLTLLTDATSIFQAKVAVGRGSGAGSAEFNAATTVLASISSFLVGAGVALAAGTTLPIDAGLASFYIGVCNLNSVLSLVFTASSLAEQNCEKSFIKRRSLPAGSTGSSHAATYNLNLKTNSMGARADSESDDTGVMRGVRRDGVYNSCSQLLALFPTDYGTPATADSACSQLSSHALGGLGLGANSTSTGASTTTDTANAAIADLQQFCSNYTSAGGQDRLMLGFANMLAALQSAEPYCFNSTGTGTGSTSSSSSKSSVSTALYLNTTYTQSTQAAAGTGASTTTTGNAAAASTASCSSSLSAAATATSSSPPSAASATSCSTGNVGTSSSPPAAFLPGSGTSNASAGSPGPASGTLLPGSGSGSASGPGSGASMGAVPAPPGSAAQSTPQPRKISTSMASMGSLAPATQQASYSLSGSPGVVVTGATAAPQPVVTVSAGSAFHPGHWGSICYLFAVSAVLQVLCR